MKVAHTLLAAAVGGLLVGSTGCASAPAAGPGATTPAGAMPAAKHDCKGKNECKGQGGCKTDKHGCKGQNDCKGNGGCKG